jgi:hypothetical protein
MMMHLTNLYVKHNTNLKVNKDKAIVLAPNNIAKLISKIKAVSP